MSKRRVEQLQRIERLRRRLHELSSFKLALVARERERLGQAHADMIAALGEGLMAYGAPAAAGARRVRGIEREIAASAAVESRLARRALDDGRLAKLADRSLEAARDEWAERQERRGLEELIEAMLGSVPRKPPA